MPRQNHIHENLVGSKNRIFKRKKSLDQKILYLKSSSYVLRVWLQKNAPIIPTVSLKIFFHHRIVLLLFHDHL